MYLFTCWRTFELYPVLSHYKESCCKCLHVWMFIYLWIYLCMEICLPASQVAESRMTIMVAVGLTFHTVHGVLKARILKWFAIPFSSGPHSVWRKLSAEELMLLNCGVGEDYESPLDCKEIHPVHSKGDQSWDFFGRNDAKAETPVLWPPHVKSLHSHVHCSTIYNSQDVEST